MQQPVALLQHRLKTLPEFVLVDVRELLQQLLQGDQLIPEPLRLQITDGRGVAGLSRCAGPNALSIQGLQA